MTDLAGLRLSVSVRTCATLARAILQRAAVSEDQETHSLAALLLDHLEQINLPPDPAADSTVIRFRSRN